MADIISSPEQEYILSAVYLGLHVRITSPNVEIIFPIARDYERKKIQYTVTRVHNTQLPKREKLSLRNLEEQAQQDSNF